MADESEQIQPRAKASRRFFFPLLIVLLATAGIVAVRIWPYEEGQDFPAKISAFTAMIVMATTFLLGLWWLFFSRTRWYFRLLPFVAIGAAATAIEIEFSGDMQPLLHWRFRRKPESLLSSEPKTVTTVAEQSPVKLDEDPLRSCIGYRGPQRDGVLPGPAPVVDWNQQPPSPLWKQPCGGGYSAFVVSGNLAATIEQRGEKEAVVGYDINTGKTLWLHDYVASFEEALGGNGPRATPTFHGDNLYSLGGTGELCALNAVTGELKWQRNILEDAEAKNLTWGMCGAPLIVEDKEMLVVNPGGDKNKAVAAYNLETGKPIWQTGEYKAGYSSPMLVTLAGQRQILLFDGKGISGLSLEDGAPLWRFQWETMEDINVAQPLVFSGDRILISSGYGSGSALLQLSIKEGVITASPLWKSKTLCSKFSNPVQYNDHIYGLDEGILACIDVETGKRLWKKGRYGHGQLVLVGDVLVILTEKGSVAAVRAKPDQFELLGEFAAIEGKTWNNPTLAGELLLVRNHQEMACFQLKRPGLSP